MDCNWQLSLRGAKPYLYGKKILRNVLLEREVLAFPVFMHLNFICNMTESCVSQAPTSLTTAVRFVATFLGGDDSLKRVVFLFLQPVL